MKFFCAIRKKWKSVLALGLAVAMLSGCGLLDDEDFAENTEDGKVTSVADPQTSSTGSSTGTTASTGSSVLFSSGAVRDHQVSLKGNGKDTVTVLVYVNGSNLETDDQEATTDLAEMVAAGSSDNVNVIVETLGTKKWDKKFGIASDRTQIYELNGNGMTLVKDDLGQKDCTDPNTLAEFIIWGAQNYPADRYILQFWDHGGGPVYGFGYDEWVSDESAALTIDEMQTALKKAGVYFDFIGMDCCLMSCMEVACALYDYCDYTILSEDFESGLGWSYTGFLKALYQNSSISTPDLAKIAIDDMVSANASDSYDGDKSILALIDESMMKVLYAAWKDFAYANESSLLGTNYSRQVVRAGGRILPSMEKKAQKGFFSDLFFDDYSSDEDSDYSLADYYITDIMALASTLDTTESAALASAVSNAIVYVNSCGDDTSLTGLSVTLPYSDSDFYSSLKTIFTNAGFDSEYVEWLGKFTSASGGNDFYDYDDWDNSWDNWDDSYEDDYDWSGWDWLFEDDYEDDYDWSDDWDYDDSWNSWFDYDDWSYDDDDESYDYNGDDWYYGDDYQWWDDWFWGDDSYDDYDYSYDDYGDDWWSDDYDDDYSYGGWDDDWGGDFGGGDWW